MPEVMWFIFYLVMLVVAAAAFRTGAVINRRLMQRQFVSSLLSGEQQNHVCVWGKWGRQKTMGSSASKQNVIGQDRRCKGCGKIESRVITVKGA